MINTAKLKGKMAEHDYSQESLADALSMSRAAFNLKLHNKPSHYFSTRHVQVMRRLLKINNPAEADTIFFAREVAEAQQEGVQG